MILKDEKYFLGDVDVLDLCKEFGTPLYVYDLSVIREKIELLKKFISSCNPQTRFLYSVKANYNLYLTKFLIEQGFGIDAVTIEEAKLALYCGCKAENIIYTECNMSDSEMDEAQKLGILINIGSLSRLEKFGAKYPGKHVCVRFNPNIGAASHATNITGGPESKFGIQFEFLDKILEIVKKYDLRLVGIHEHLGSGWLKIKEPLIAVEFLLMLAQKIPDLEFLDFGGGFGVPYKSNRSSLDLESLGKEIERKLIVFKKKYDKEVKLIFEPGRFLVAESGHLLTQVTTLKTSTSQIVYAGTDSGMNQLVRVAMYGSYHHMINVSNPSGVGKSYHICGNVCESADFFAKRRRISEIREGDILSIEVAGAYGMSMASNYQFRSLPAEVVIDGNKVIQVRKRQSFEDLIGFFK
jgi:diaminopimelate decarboxylase